MMAAALALCTAILKVFEGCRLKAYQDIVGVWTICFGSTKGVTPGMVKTMPECLSLLDMEAGAFMLRVLKDCPALAADPAKLAACTSFAYNLGLGAFRASTLRRKCLRGEWAEAAREFAKWNKAGGRPVRGLTLRRAAEARLFESGHL